MRRLRSATVLVSIFLTAATAQARPRRARRTPADTETSASATSASARRHAESARILFELQEYDGAVDEWKEAYRLKASPLLLFNIGQATRMSGRLHEARRAYASYLESIGSGPGPKNGPPRREVELRLSELEAKLSFTDGAKPRRSVVTSAAPASPVAKDLPDQAGPARAASTAAPFEVRAPVLLTDLRLPVRAPPVVAPPSPKLPLPVDVGPRPARIASAVLAVTSAGLTVAGAFFQFQARTLESDALAFERPRSELDTRLLEAQAMGTQALWYGAGALAAGATALGLWWWDRADEAAE
jgi:hypothetical protein